MKKKKWIITSVILVVFCTGLVVYNHYRGSSSAADADPSEISIPRKSSVLNVNGLVVRPQTLTDGITSVGSLLPDEEVDLSFETSGKIVSINFQEGSTVRKGELLAKVNDKPLLAQLSRYEAQLKLAEDRVYRQSACSKRTPSAWKPTNRHAPNWRCSTPISTSCVRTSRSRSCTPRSTA